jgi:hypothetical protein
VVVINLFRFTPSATLSGANLFEKGCQNKSWFWWGYQEPNLFAQLFKSWPPEA